MSWYDWNAVEMDMKMQDIHPWVEKHVNNMETKTAEFVNSVDLHEVAQNEPPSLDLHCLPLI